MPTSQLSTAKSSLIKCDTCGGNGWFVWGAVGAVDHHRKLVWSACADCNDNTQKAVPTTPELTQLIEQHTHAVEAAEFHWRDNGQRALYGGDIMWAMGWADWAIEAAIIETKISLYLRLLNV